MFVLRNRSLAWWPRSMGVDRLPSTGPAYTALPHVGRSSWNTVSAGMLCTHWHPQGTRRHIVNLVTACASLAPPATPSVTDSKEPPATQASRLATEPPSHSETPPLPPNSHPSDSTPPIITDPGQPSLDTADIPSPTSQPLHINLSNPTLQPNAIGPATCAPSTRVVLVGVDPDTHGAIAVAVCNLQDLEGSPDNISIKDMQIEVYDMPCAIVTLTKRSKTGEPLKRRWLDVVAAQRLIKQILERHGGTSNGTAGNGAEPGWQASHTSNIPHGSNGVGDTPHGSNGVGNILHGSNGVDHILHGSNGVGHIPKSVVSVNREMPGLQKHSTTSTTSAVHEGMGNVEGTLGSTNGVHVAVELRAFVESSPTIPFNSRPSTLASQVYSIGAWHGLLQMAGFKTSTVPATVWKRDLALVGVDKSASLALAKQLWPHRADILARKMDHGRAEAMLIAAWALGLSRQPPPGTSSPTRARRRAPAIVATPPAILASEVPVAAPATLSPIPSDSPPALAASEITVSNSTSTDSGMRPREIQSLATARECEGVAVPEGAAAGGAVEVPAAAVPVAAGPAEGGAVAEEGAVAEGGAEVAEGVPEGVPVEVEPSKAELNAAITREIVIRAEWPLKQKGLRHSDPTDGYGNLLPPPPGALDAEIHPVAPPPPKVLKALRTKAVRRSETLLGETSTAPAEVQATGPTLLKSQRVRFRPQQPGPTGDSNLPLLTPLQGSSAASLPAPGTPPGPAASVPGTRPAAQPSPGAALFVQEGRPPKSRTAAARKQVVSAGLVGARLDQGIQGISQQEQGSLLQPLEPAVGLVTAGKPRGFSIMASYDRSSSGNAGYMGRSTPLQGRDQQGQQQQQCESLQGPHLQPQQQHHVEHTGQAGGRNTAAEQQGEQHHPGQQHARHIGDQAQQGKQQTKEERAAKRAVNRAARNAADGAMGQHHPQQEGQQHGKLQEAAPGVPTENEKQQEQQQERQQQGGEQEREQLGALPAEHVTIQLQPMQAVDPVQALSVVYSMQPRIMPPGSHLNVPQALRLDHLPNLDSSMSPVQVLGIVYCNGSLQHDSQRVVRLVWSGRWRMQGMDRTYIDNKQLLGFSVLPGPVTGSIVQQEGQGSLLNSLMLVVHTRDPPSVTIESMPSLHSSSKVFDPEQTLRRR